ncbi:MAG: hypothetical protein IK086_01450, partial [Clostridia bacterium]|nr:hypothetical protein [Clostridia bacterium]
MTDGSYSILNKKEIKDKYSSNIAKLSPFDIGIPLIDISDKTIEEIYYYRWHTFCRHIRPTDDGYVITEFYPDVPWAGKNNTISCAAGHHFNEGRWLYDGKYLAAYAKFWFTPGAQTRRYSFWAASAIYSFCEITGDFSVAEQLYGELKENYRLWEEEKGSINGMYYQVDLQDGMEYSAGGSGLRPTINSYMYGDAVALSKIAKRIGKTGDADMFLKKAAALKDKINTVLWDKKAEFFKTMNVETGKLVEPREQIGYVPWYFDIPDNDKASAWKFLNDENYFYAPFGPTTAERNCPDFMKEFDHDCLWNGPSWPYATSQTLTALGNLLCDYKQSVMKKGDYYALLHLYAACQYLNENGEKTPFIDENIEPFTGIWLARELLKSRPVNDVHPKDRGAHYNHSTFCDLVL